MFGEILLIGEDRLKVSKGSFKLPAFTKAERGEILCFLNLGKEIRLYSEEQYDIFTDKFLELYRKNHNLKELLNFKRLLVGECTEENTVTSKCTITSKFLKENNSIIFVGADDHVKIFTDEEQYGLYKRKKV